MPYQPSSAIVRLGAEFDALRTVLSNYIEARRDIPRDVRKLVLMAAVLSSFAKLESYFDDLFDRFAKGLNGLHGTGSLSSLDPKLRAVVLASEKMLEEAHRRLLGLDNPVDYLQRLEKIVDSPLLQFATAAAGKPISLTAASLHTNKKYPSPTNVKRIMCRIGASNFFRDMSKRYHFDAENFLQSLNDIRTEIAHEGSLPVNMSSIADVRKYIGRVLSFAKRTDRVLYVYVESTAGIGSRWWARYIAKQGC